MIRKPRKDGRPSSFRVSSRYPLPSTTALASFPRACESELLPTQGRLKSQVLVRARDISQTLWGPVNLGREFDSPARAPRLPRTGIAARLNGDPPAGPRGRGRRGVTGQAGGQILT